MDYETIAEINHTVEQWCDNHFPGLSDDDFRRMAKSADVEFLNMCGELKYFTLDKQNVAWDRFRYLSKSAIDS